VDRPRGDLPDRTILITGRQITAVPVRSVFPCVALPAHERYGQTRTHQQTDEGDQLWQPGQTGVRQ
jgi:hypothetical protein